MLPLRYHKQKGGRRKPSATRIKKEAFHSTTLPPTFRWAAGRTGVSPPDVTVSTAVIAAELPSPSGAVAERAFDGESGGYADGDQGSERDDDGCLFHGLLLSGLDRTSSDQDFLGANLRWNA
ncbi:MAG: hypothetical protein KF712_03100 [Akkermansiaceae bacterium]|nr:hypothetical protein [Akkermansiaceae bacterium]